MSNAVRRREQRAVGEVRTTQEIVRATRQNWTPSEDCEREEFINCSFGADGECKNPRHHAAFTKE